MTQKVYLAKADDDEIVGIFWTPTAARRALVRYETEGEDYGLFNTLADGIDQQSLLYTYMRGNWTDFKDDIIDWITYKINDEDFENTFGSIIEYNMNEYIYDMNSAEEEEA